MESSAAIDEPYRLEPRDACVDFRAVYDHFFPSVYRWVGALGGPNSDQEDLTQEVFVVVQRKLGEFDGRNLAGWLYRITERTVSDYRRRSWFRHLFLRRRDVELNDVQGSAPTQGELLERKEEQQCFYRLVAKMNPKWRNSFVLFEIAGYSGDEIAVLEDVPPATVRTHLHRARKEFLELVKRERS